MQYRTPEATEHARCKHTLPLPPVHGPCRVTPPPIPQVLPHLYMMPVTVLTLLTMN